VEHLKYFCPLGIFVGFVTVVATSIALSLLSVVIFSHLITDDAPLNILNISTGPLIYSLLVILVAVVVGILVSSKLAKYNSLTNAIGVPLLYALFSYWLSQSPSNIGKYPEWYVLASYLELLPATAIGFFLSSWAAKNA
jgi:hypothetical protein